MNVENLAFCNMWMQKNKEISIIENGIKWKSWGQRLAFM